MSSLLLTLGKDGAIMSLSEENARLQSELESLRMSPEASPGLTNGDTSEDNAKLQSHIQGLTAHVSYCHGYRAFVIYFKTRRNIKRVNWLRLFVFSDETKRIKIIKKLTCAFIRLWG